MKKLKIKCNNKIGVSQRKLAKKFSVCHKTIGNNLKRLNIKYRKRTCAQKSTPEQEKKEIEALQNLCSGDRIFSDTDTRDIIMDDES